MTILLLMPPEMYKSVEPIETRFVGQLQPCHENDRRFDQMVTRRCDFVYRDICAEGVNWLGIYLRIAVGKSETGAASKV